MNLLPSIPTDNLYKFLFITGLTIMLLSIVLFITQAEKSYTKRSNLEIELAKFVREQKTLSHDLNEMEREQKQIDSLLKKNNYENTDPIKYFEVEKEKLYKDKDYREYLSFLLQHKEDLIPFYKQLTLNEILLEKIDAKNRELKTNLGISEEKLSQMHSENFILTILSTICPIIMFIGYMITFTAYNKWLKLVQIPMDEKLRLELEKLKSEVNK